MSHFAKVEDGIVTQVIVAEQDFIDTLESPDSWVRTSYNTRGGKHYAPNSDNEDSGTPLRKNFAGIGHIYDSMKDAFYLPQPFSSWTLNDQTCQWEAPVAHPDDGKMYTWDEDNTKWEEVPE